LLSQPTKLKQRFLDDLAAPNNALGKDLNPTEIAAVITLGTATDFTMFKSVEL
jgi:flagellar biosynthesis regulator FlaF